MNSGNMLEIQHKFIAKLLFSLIVLFYMKKVKNMLGFLVKFVPLI